MASVTVKETTIDKPVGMGQIAVARKPVRLTAVLGSCIGVVLHHSRLQLGLLAHVVLPDSSCGTASAGRAKSPGKFADTAIPKLLETLQAHGGTPAGAVAKIVGGSRMFGKGGPMQIGENNATAVIRALQLAGIRVAAKDIGGTTGRRISLDCGTGTLTVETVGNPSRTL